MVLFVDLRKVKAAAAVHLVAQCSWYQSGNRMLDFFSLSLVYLSSAMIPLQLLLPLPPLLMLSRKKSVANGHATVFRIELQPTRNVRNAKLS